MEDNRDKIEKFLNLLTDRVGAARGAICEVSFPGRKVKRVKIGNALLDLMFDGLGRIVIPPNLNRLALEAEMVIIDGKEVVVVKKERVEDDAGDTAYWALKVE